MNHRKLFQLLILLLPTQLGIHFWPDWSLFFGIRIDYLSPVIYLIDIILLIILLIWLSNVRIKKNINNKFILYIFLLNILFITNIYVSGNRYISIIYWLNIIKLLLLILYVAKNKISVNDITKPLSLAIIGTLIIATLQFIKGGTLGGLFYLIGERNFNINTPGIALVKIFNYWYIRPYASFPHPNAMAGFALVSAILLKASLNKSKLIKTAFVSAIMLIIISFSKTAYIIGLVLIIININKLNKIKLFIYKNMVYMFLIIAFIVLILSTFVLQSGMSLPKNIQERAELSVIAGNLWAENPITGIGANNFIINIPNESRELSHIVGKSTYRFFQPVHNLFLLVTVETGILGLVGFVYLLKICLANIIKNKHNYLMQILFVVLLTGAMDHYWITLLQTNMLLAIIVGLCLQSKSVKIISK